MVIHRLWFSSSKKALMNAFNEFGLTECPSVVLYNCTFELLVDSENWYPFCIRFTLNTIS